MLVGEDDIAGVAVPLEVRIPSGYPYVPPKVRPIDGSGGAGWHQERDGSLCLWDAERAQPDWWTSRNAVVERVRDWFHQAANGWRDDAPDMDLDRYWPQSLGLVLYDELPTFGWVRLSGGPSPRHVCPVWKVKGNGSSSKRGRAAGYVISIGEPDRPPRSLPELLLLADGDEVGAALDKQQVGWLIVRYQRHGVGGVLALRMTYDTTGVTGCTALSTASTARSARQMRAGVEARELASASVAVVGAGAIGSFVADLLARSGVLHFSIIDSDIIKPGNLVRHVLGEGGVGEPKATALRQHLADRHGVAAADMTAAYERIDDLAAAVELLASHDLVVNATGGVAVTVALDHAAEVLDKPVVTVATTQEGRVIRVDCSPRRQGEVWLDDPALPPTGLPPLLEDGCGSPISPTPPWAVTLAASYAARTVVCLLTGQPAPVSYVQAVSVGLPPEAATC